MTLSLLKDATGTIFGATRICRDITHLKKAEERILAHPWPGNVRELRNAVERIILLERGEKILEKHLSFLGGGRKQIRLKGNLSNH